MPVPQLPNSRVVVSLVASLQLATLGAFVYDMLPLVPDKMPEACLLVLCLMAVILLHYRQVSDERIYQSITIVLLLLEYL